LEKAIANKNIIISDNSDFNSIPGFDPNQYGEIIKGESFRYGKSI
jgi:hypothetical protein